MISILLAKENVNENMLLLPGYIKDKKKLRRMYKKDMDSYQEGGNMIMDLENEAMDIYAEDDMFNRDISRRNDTAKRKKGRPRKSTTIISTYNMQYNGQSVKEFEGLTLVYHCPFIHCSRFYATKLALKRHFLSYVHFSTCEDIGQEYISHTLLTDDQRMLIMRSMPRKFKCPAIDCYESFESHHALCGHFSKWHTMNHDNGVVDPSIRYNNLVHDLYEWTSVYDECMDVAFHPVYDVASMVPRIYSSRADKLNWRLLSIFDCIGPCPSVKRAQLLNSFREFLMSSHTSTNSSTMLIDENGLRLMIIIGLMELMPKGFITTRDYIPSIDEMNMPDDFIPHPALDEKFLRMTTKESVLSMKKYGAVHSSRNYLKKVKMSMRNKDGEVDMSDEDGESDRFVCQFPGCAKPFASLPAYKYHMHHYEHDLQSLIEQSTYIRSVLFPEKGDEHYDPDPLSKGRSRSRGVFNVNGLSTPPAWSNYDRISLKFVSGQRTMHLDEDIDMDGQLMSIGRHTTPITNLVYSVNDAIHLLHGYLDQQLPIIIGWSAMKKRDTVVINMATQEFTLTLRRNDNVSMIKREKPPVSGSGDLINKRRRSMFMDNSMNMMLRNQVYNNGIKDNGIQENMEDPVELKSIYSRKRQGLSNKPQSPEGFERNQFCDYRCVLGVYQQYLRSSQVLNYQQQCLTLHMMIVNNMIDNDTKMWVDYSSAIYREDLQISPKHKELLSSTEKSNPPVLIVHKGSNDEEPPKTISMQPFTGEVLDIRSSIMYNYKCEIKAMGWFPYVQMIRSDYYVAALSVIMSSPLVTGGDCLVIWNVGFTMSSESPTDIRFDKVWLSWIHQLDMVEEDDSKKDEGERTAITVTAIQWYPFILSENDNAMSGILALLVSTHEIYVYSIRRSVIFTSPPNIHENMNVFSNEETNEDDISSSLLRRAMSLEKVCKISVESYHISCFCWNKQQSSNIGPSVLTNITVQIIFGTHEGYIGICDLSSPTAPQMLMLIPGHEKLITSIDWSPTNMLSVITSSIDGSVHLWNLADMFHRVGLASSIQPCLSAKWLLSACRPYEATNNNISMSTRKHGNDNSDRWDLSLYILVSGDSDYGKIISATTDQRAIQIQGSSLPIGSKVGERIWTSVYPNGRNDGCLLGAISWDGDLEILGCHNPMEVPWTTRYVSSFQYDDKENYYTLKLLGEERDNLSGIDEINKEPEMVEHSASETDNHARREEKETERRKEGFTGIAWHPLPLRMLAAVSSTGVIQLHIME